MSIRYEVLATAKVLVCVAWKCDLHHEIDDSADRFAARMRFRCTRCGTVTPWKTWQGNTRAMLERAISELARKGVRP
jgi:hypothetical protein